MFIHRIGPANWLAFICFAWGLVSIGIGFLHNWVGLAVCRAILGVLEAGFFPGFVLPPGFRDLNSTDKPTGVSI